MGVQADAFQRIGGYKLDESEAVGRSGKRGGVVALKADPVSVLSVELMTPGIRLTSLSSGFLTRGRGMEVVGLDGGGVCKAASTGLASLGAG